MISAGRDEHSLAGLNNGQDLHVLGDIRAKSLVETDSDKSVGLTSEINHLPLFPVLAPGTNSPSSPGTSFGTVVGAIMRRIRMSQFDGCRSRDRRGLESSFPL